MSPLVLLLAVANANPLVAIVVVDQEARESGYSVEVDGWLVPDALPVDVAEGEHVVIVEPDGRTEALDVAPGEAWEVTGELGEAWMSRLDEEVRTDLIAVRGSKDSIEALAESLGAEIVVDDAMTYLARDGVLFDAPWVEDEVALEVEEVGLVSVEDSEPAQAIEPDATPPSQPFTRIAPVATAVTPHEHVAVAARHAPPVMGNVVGTVECTEDHDTGAIQLDDETGLIETAMDVGDDQDLAVYSGMHLCRDDVLWLHPAGVYGFRGITGTWSVSTPGVVRLYTEAGDVLFRAAISPTTGHCRDVWSPEETGQPMPKGYERVTTESRKRFGPKP